MIVLPAALAAQDGYFEPEGKAPTSPPDAHLAYLAQAYGVDRGEAQDRWQAMQQVSELVTSARSEDPEAFADVWIQHDPVFKNFVSFTGK